MEKQKYCPNCQIGLNQLEINVGYCQNCDESINPEWE